MEKKMLFRTTALVFIIVCVVFSCVEKTNEKSDLQVKIDSLTQLTETQQKQIGNMEGFIISIAETMDSIDAQEKELIAEGNIEKRDVRRKKDIINNLQRFKETIERQKKLIAELEEKLSEQNDKMSARMLQIVAFYKKELESKDRTIAALQSNIESNKRDIKFLRESVDKLMATTEEMDKTIKEQDNTLMTQTNMINKCYIRMGTKKELKTAGLLTGGFLAKKKLDTSNLRQELFTEMDMRNCNDIVVNSSNPKILTQMPASSYEFVKKDNGSCYLHIISPSSFWSISKFLVIQL